MFQNEHNKFRWSKGTSFSLHSLTPLGPRDAKKRNNVEMMLRSRKCVSYNIIFSSNMFNLEMERL